MGRRSPARQTQVRQHAVDLLHERPRRIDGEERAVSDGRWAVYRAQQERRSPLDELPADSHLAVDSSRPLVEQLDGVLAHLGLPRQ